jgi:2-polyprenyl-3-methyl-5-hydroxy-6-metoxy-1,4-benzoquinol methylase
MKINYTNCPVCNETTSSAYLTVSDFSVTKENFDLLQCTNCTLVYTQNIPDQNTIAPYYHFEEYISHTDTKKSLFHKIYHFVRKITLRKKLGWIQNAIQKNTGNLLDIGCGTGAFLAYAKKNNWTVQGIEADATARAKAVELYGIATAASEAFFTLPKNSYDAISMWHVLEHVHNLQGYMQQIKNLLTTDGKLFIAVPNYTSYDAQQYKNYWAAYDVPRHLYHFSPKAIQQLAIANGFAIEKYQPMWYDSFYVSMLSEKYKKGSGILGIIIGLISNLNALFNPKKCSSITYILSKK